MKESEELKETIKRKHERDIEEIKRKHKLNLELMESKFNTESQLLADEFDFLTKELEKLKAIKERKAQDLPDNRNSEIEAKLATKELEQAKNMLIDMKSKSNLLESEIHKIVN